MPKKGYKATDVHKWNLSKALTGKRKSKEIREKIRVKLTGTHPSEITRIKMKKYATLKRKLHSALIKHLTKIHPDAYLKFYPGQRMWRECPKCGLKLNAGRIHSSPPSEN